MTQVAVSSIILAFGLVCLFVFMGTKALADEARGERRFYLIGFYRSVLLALGIVSLMIGVSRLLALFVP
jgi:hypothetical protein